MVLSRRSVLLATGVGLFAAGCSSTQTDRVTASTTKHAYGEDPNQFGELYRPASGSKPGTVVIIHGGFWRAQYNLSFGRPLAADLVRRGYTVWNLEYRRVGQGGGWPGTFADVAAGIDHLAELDVDTGHVCAVGHSAGGQLAGWAVARQHLPATAPGARPRVVTTAAVSQAGVLDLATAANDGVGATAVPDVMGGTPAQVPERYRLVDPIELLPVGARVLCVHARADDTVPFAQSTAYVDAAHRAGSQATLVPVVGDHFTVIDPASPAWGVVVDALPGLLEH